MSSPPPNSQSQNPPLLASSIFLERETNASAAFTELLIASALIVEAIMEYSIRPVPNCTKLVPNSPISLLPIINSKRPPVLGSSWANFTNPSEAVADAVIASASIPVTATEY